MRDAMNYPYIFIDEDCGSLTYGQYSVRIDEGTSYDGYTKEKAEELLETHIQYEGGNYDA